MSLRSPLGRVLGLGTTSGVHHWWQQRVSSIALLPLGLWFVVSLLMLPDHAYGTVHAWLARPWNAVLMLLFVWTSVQHSRLGVQVVLEDYVHGAGVKVAALLAAQFIHLVIGAAALLAVLKVALGSAA
jgi:succinate dehydrogenase / fumarate reductase, membrane anchor subunit